VSKALIIFIQIKNKTESATVSALFVQRKVQSSTNGGGGTSMTPSKSAGLKRYIRVRLNDLPKLQKIPIIGTIDAPADAIDYVFVQQNFNDKTRTGGTTGGTPKATSGDSSGATPSTNSIPAIRSGHLFMVISEGKVVPDHRFGSNSNSPQPTPTPMHRARFLC
jgi:hypothetical protein